jgi:hypothetical protein
MCAGEERVPRFKACFDKLLLLSGVGFYHVFPTSCSPLFPTCLPQKHTMRTILIYYALTTIILTLTVLKHRSSLPFFAAADASRGGCACAASKPLTACQVECCKTMVARLTTALSEIKLAQFFPFQMPSKTLRRCHSDG